MSETSTPYTPASTSITVAENETVTLMDKIKKDDTVKLIEFLQGQENLGLNKPAIKILENEEVNDLDFFDLTQKELERYGMKLGLVKRLVKFTKECKDKKLRAFSTYKTKKDLRKVLRKYEINSSEITKIPPFELKPVEIDNKNEELEQCITEIKRRMGIISSATSRNEARVDSHNKGKTKEFGGGIHVEHNATRKLSPYKHKKKKASVVFDDEFDYLYRIVIITLDWYFLMYTSERIYCSKDNYHIVLNEKIIKDNTELCCGVKKVMKVIIGLFKYRVKVGDSSDKKRARTRVPNGSDQIRLIDKLDL
ncbi:hypothetical protein RhiirC2_782351 [Rhizophagus irregularis]|uniref:SAM domain-containing protein n=1 Tax=Rhizophagus irregularis TaxID=588596 RepID=A0A2N1N379_9GLOM|nr:hypothetical protein RhiirC2_782351 [Rhizophagus irregularis]